MRTLTFWISRKNEYVKMNKNNWLNLFFLLLMKIKYVIIKELEWEVSTDGFFVEKLAIQVLNDEAERIKRLIRNQNNSLCISQCKAFEEVVDTQMYGFSRQVGFAVRIGVIGKNEGQLMLSELERELNQLYSEVYQENYDKKEVGKEE